MIIRRIVFRPGIVAETWGLGPLFSVIEISDDFRRMLTPDQFEFVDRHEMAHVRYWHNAISMPLYWLMRLRLLPFRRYRRVRLAFELAADAWAARGGRADAGVSLFVKLQLIHRTNIGGTGILRMRKLLAIRATQDGTAPPLPATPPYIDEGEYRDRYDEIRY